MNPLPFEAPFGDGFPNEAEKMQASFTGTRAWRNMCTQPAHTHTHIHTHTPRHKDTQKHRHTDIQARRHTDIQTRRHIDTQTPDAQTHRNRHTHTHIYARSGAIETVIFSHASVSEHMRWRLPGLLRVFISFFIFHIVRIPFNSSRNFDRIRCRERWGSE